MEVEGALAGWVELLLGSLTSGQFASHVMEGLLVVVFHRGQLDQHLAEVRAIGVLGCLAIEGRAVTFDLFGHLIDFVGIECNHLFSPCQIRSVCTNS